MAFVPVSNTALVEFVYEQHGQVCENTMWFDHGSSIAVADLTGLVSDLLSWWIAQMRPLLSIDTTLIRMKATDMTTATSPSYEQGISASNVGLVNSSSQANSVTWAIKFTTALRGRSFRGRNYIIGIPGNAIADNAVSSEFANNVQLAYLEINPTLLLSGWEHVVVSKFTGGAPRASGLVTQVLSYSYTDLTLDAQRRRLPGRGD